MGVSWKSRFLSALSLPLLALCYSQVPETFEEELTLRALRDGKVAARFSFKTLLEDATPRSPLNLSVEDDSQHYTLFPLALGQILREYAVTELHLTLNAGKWDYARVDARWRDLRNALAGLFCASLAALDEQRTTAPAATFTPHGALPALPHSMRHAALPPSTSAPRTSRRARGRRIAAQLAPLFDADWHGMGLHVQWTPAGVEVRLAFQAVFDPLRSGGTKRDWSFSALFDRTIVRRCPSASASSVRVALPVGEAYGIDPKPDTVEGGFAVFDLLARADALDVAMSWPATFDYQRALAPAQRPISHSAEYISVARTLHGASQAHGALALAITNAGPRDVRAAYLETVPGSLVRVGERARDDLLTHLSYAPSPPSSSPHVPAHGLHAHLTLPAHSTLHLHVGVRKAFLRYTEHPPDAQRGWDLPAGVLVLLDMPSFGNSTGAADGMQDGPAAAYGAIRIYTPALLVDLATPDFSMPYNVIIFSCSLVAFLFGSVFNLLTRRFVVVKVDG
ncbi:Gpi16 subunit, GPI transamidase component-domain-containing protein [Mycena sp. CBHHK59/15]|nr:Gpi16 subunit, GPI transamidase component-domain-containing protein [Mycena sp. CBHHK59/15]